MTTSAPGAHVTAEIASQPETWARAAALAATSPLPESGQAVAVVGCGTSAFIAQSYAAEREAAGHGRTDAFVASEYPTGRRYDKLIAISRSGTTTEVLQLLRAMGGRQPSLAIVGDPNTPGASAADEVVLLPFADERSVVQTRFATAVLALLRAGLRQDLDPVIEQARAALAADLPAGWEQAEQFVFLGRGPGVGLANEAALKMREAALAWAESYPAMDYRHGPISLAEPRTLVWLLTEPAAGLVEQITQTGARVEVAAAGVDPLAELVRVQRTAVALALHRGLDPDHPRNLTRSVVLPAESVQG